MMTPLEICSTDQKEYNVGEAKPRCVNFELPKNVRHCPQKFWRNLKTKVNFGADLSTNLTSL